MANLVKAFKRAATAFKESFGPSEYMAGGNKVICDQCGGSEFIEGSARVYSLGMTFAKLDWADKSVTTLACTNCGKIQWFIGNPERIE